MKNLNLSWSWSGLFLGPFYFFMCSAYLAGFILLIILYFLNFSIGFIGTIIIAIVSALIADSMVDGPLNKKHKKLRDKLIKKGHSNYDLERELRRRERGMSFGIVFSALGALLLYWGSTILVITFVYQLAK